VLGGCSGVAKPVPTWGSYACDPQQNSAYAYRKKVAVLGFAVNNLLDTVDVPIIGQRYPQELARRLSSEQFVVIDSSSERLFEQTANDDLTAPVRQQIVTLAGKLGVQTLVSGRILDLSVNTPRNLLTRMALGTARQVDMELAVYDGLSGTLIASERFIGNARGAMDMTYRNMGSDFWTSNFGQALQTMIDQQAKLIGTALSCLPMQAIITHVDQQGIHFDAGADVLLRPGDRLELIKLIPLDPRGGPMGGDIYQEKRQGSMTVSTVYPDRAVGILDKKGPLYRLNRGDIVRAW